MLATPLKYFRRDLVNNYIFKNISYSFFFKGLTIAGQLYLIPLTIDLLDKEAFGIWITISTIINWIAFFDLGIGNGLRNKLVVSLSKGNFKEARQYISTTYMLISFIGCCLALVYGIFNAISPIKYLLFKSDSEHIQAGLDIAIYLFILRFFLMTISYLNFALQKSSRNDLLQFANILITIITLLAFKKFDSLGFISVILIYSLSPILIYSCYSILFFKDRRNLIPNILFYRKELVKHLLTDGLSFSFIQIVSLLLFTFPVFLISKQYGSAYVTEYNIANRMYGMVYMVLSIILTPFWSAFTKASFEKKELWMQSVLQKLQFLSYGFVLLLSILYFLSSFIYDLWIGNKVIIENGMNTSLAIYNLTLLLIAPLNYYLNGRGFLKIQVYLSLLDLIVYFPLFYFLSHFLGLAATGVVYTSAIILLFNYLATVISIKMNNNVSNRVLA